MIHPFSIAIIYGGQRSLVYAEIMQDLINTKSNEMPLIPLLVNTTNNGFIYNTVVNTFKSSDYGIVFISEVYTSEIPDQNGYVSMTTPNLLFELGYLINKLGLEKIKIILDFPYEKIKLDQFAFPSDLTGDYLCAVPELKNASDRKIEQILSDVLDRELTKIKNDHLLSDIKQIQSFNDYLPGFKEIFKWEMDNNINHYSLDKQYEFVFESWKKEINEFRNMSNTDADIINNYILMYLYERVLFLPVFHETICSNIQDFRISNSLHHSLIQRDESLIYNYIIEYIEGKPTGTSEFFKQCAKVIDSKIDGLLCAHPLIYIIANNYLGLCYLNFFQSIQREGNAVNNNFENSLYSASECFDTVISATKKHFSGTVDEDLICSFAFYNKARVLSLLNKNQSEWIYYYDKAIAFRKNLSKQNDFPLFIRLYFKNEMYHAINRKIMDLKNFWNKSKLTVDKNIIFEAITTEKNILTDLKQYEETIVAGQSFFKSVKTDALENINELNLINQ